MSNPKTKSSTPKHKLSCLCAECEKYRNVNKIVIVPEKHKNTSSFETFSNTSHQCINCSTLSSCNTDSYDSNLITSSCNSSTEYNDGKCISMVAAGRCPPSSKLKGKYYIDSNTDIIYKTTDCCDCKDTQWCPYATINTGFVTSMSNKGLTLKSVYAGGMYFYSDPTCNFGVGLEPNGSSWSYISDKDTKNIISEVKLGAIEDDKLKSFCSIPLYHYTFKDDPTNKVYMGPMAQDFNEKSNFLIKRDPKNINEKVISDIDMHGVLIYSIKELYELYNNLKDQISNLKN